MMWNWLVSGLAVGATLCLFDGSPFAPDGNVLFDYAEAEKFASSAPRRNISMPCARPG
jgi:acetoacetyl-CoA synthetase